MTFEERMKAYSDSIEPVPIDEERLRKAIETSKAVLYQGELQNPLSRIEFLLQQAGYIRKRWWVAQALILIFLWWFLLTSGATVYARRFMGIFASLFAIFLMPELWKSKNCGCMEVEAVSYFSIRKIYAARMLWFFMTDLLLLSIFFAVSLLTLKLAIGEMIVQFFMPMNVTCCICFHGLSSNRPDSNYFSFGMSVVWTGVWILIVLQENIYQAITGPMWATAVILSVLLFISLIFRVWRSCERYWEVCLSWN